MKNMLFIYITHLIHIFYNTVQVIQQSRLLDFIHLLFSVLVTYVFMVLSTFLKELRIYLAQ